ncbi:MAG: PIN domain-containing protein [Spirochaetaceae bacterium]|jgi:PIN domain nuclease of toxin-antitoxin system|nr:PIN domain-containing protein [Spirochaetaceae bacterium]
MIDSYVLDACALIAYFKDEKGWELIDDLIERAALGELRLTMSKYNLLEVYYGFYSDDGKDRAEEMLRDVYVLPIQIAEDLSDAVFHEAGRLKASYSISLADAVALGLASASGVPLVTSDHHEFSVIEQGEAIAIHWYR